jgi:hypothetical protein
VIEVVATDATDARGDDDASAAGVHAEILARTSLVSTLVVARQTRHEVLRVFVLNGAEELRCALAPKRRGQAPLMTYLHLAVLPRSILETRRINHWALEAA